MRPLEDLSLGELLLEISKDYEIRLLTDFNVGVRPGHHLYIRLKRGDSYALSSISYMELKHVNMPVDQALKDTLIRTKEKLDKEIERLAKDE